MLKLENELWADENGKAVPYNDIRGKTVLFGAGTQVTAEQMRQHGIREDGTPDDGDPQVPVETGKQDGQDGQDVLLTAETPSETQPDAAEAGSSSPSPRNRNR